MKRLLFLIMITVVAFSSCEKDETDDLDLDYKYDNVYYEMQISDVDEYGGATFTLPLTVSDVTEVQLHSQSVYKKYALDSYSMEGITLERIKRDAKVVSEKCTVDYFRVSINGTVYDLK